MQFQSVQQFGERKYNPFDFTSNTLDLSLEPEPSFKNEIICGTLLK